MENLSGFALAESFSVAASRAVEAVSAASDAVSSTASAAMETPRDGCELQQHIAKRSHRFVEGFARTCVEATGRNVSDAGESLRMTTLNCAIRSEASAMSDVPALERAAKAMSASAKAALEEYERRSSALPSLRYELLEDMSEKKMALEKKIEAVSAPREQKRKQVLKELMSKPA